MICMIELPPATEPAALSCPVATLWSYSCSVTVLRCAAFATIFLATMLVWHRAIVSSLL